ncbi:MAG: hypothetical protein RBG13Loki_2923 [Promethearchaeota archaeon CR_4]|nr:MAG: hypothetical protein RBG13Loki_2923 [Candidatus Lokiarchaeota archaeon CR_4]
MGRGNAPQLHEVSFRTAEEDGDVLGMRATNLDPFLEGVEGRSAGRVVEEESPFRAEGVAG